MHKSLFFAGTAIDPLVGMVMLFTIAYTLHFLIAIVFALLSRLFVEKLIRKKVSKIVFTAHLVLGGLYIWPILIAPVSRNKFVLENLLALVIGYGLFSILIALTTIVIFRRRNKA